MQEESCDLSWPPAQASGGSHEHALDGGTVDASIVVSVAGWTGAGRPPTALRRGQGPGRAVLTGRARSGGS